LLSEPGNNASHFDESAPRYAVGSLTVPAAYDVLWPLVVLLVLPLTIVSLLRWRAAARSTSRSVGWLLVILLLPGLGAVVHLAVTPRPDAIGDGEPAPGR